jgi:hypothetical protein
VIETNLNSGASKPEMTPSAGQVGSDSMRVAGLAAQSAADAFRPIASDEVITAFG